MNSTMIVNHWLMIVSWCLLLNGYDHAAVAVALIAAALAFFRCREVNIWRFGTVEALMYLAVILAMKPGHIPYFFPTLPYFMIAVCIDAAAVNELLGQIKTAPILAVMMMILISSAVLSLIIVILPEASYTLFGKANLFLLEAFIFLPYLVPAGFHVHARLAARYGRKKITVS